MSISAACIFRKNVVARVRVRFPLHHSRRRRDPEVISLQANAERVFGSEQFIELTPSVLIRSQRSSGF